MRYHELIYEGDGILHGPASTQDIERYAPELPAFSIGTLFERVLDWLENQAHASRQRRIDDYLSQACDLADLERRMRDLERRREFFG